MKNIMYRTEDTYGSGIRDINKVLYYEIFELNNIDILDYISEHYLDGELKQECLDLIDNENFGNYGDDAAYEFISNIITTINNKTNHNLKYALWLADKDAVKELYNGESIDAYRISDVILSDLGYDGILFGYDEEPIPLESIEEEYDLEYGDYERPPINDGELQKAIDSGMNKEDFYGSVCLDAFFKGWPAGGCVWEDIINAYDYDNGASLRIWNDIKDFKEISDRPKTIRIYRAVPNDVTDTEIHNGDWVTITSAYAKKHGDLRYTDNYHILSKLVTTAEVWWAGDHICEFGYDSNTIKWPKTESNKLEEKASIDWNNYLTPEEVEKFLQKDDKVESAENIVYAKDFRDRLHDFKKSGWTRRELTQDLANFYYNNNLIRRN